MTINDLRTQYSLTQQALSDLTHIPKRTIEQWEGGKRNPPPYIYPLIEVFLQVKLNH